MAKTKQDITVMNNLFDPYLSWAKLTGYAGFSDINKQKKPIYLIALERLDGETTNPFETNGGDDYPSVGLRQFPGNEKIFIGNAGNVERVEELAGNTNYRVELNMSRYRPIDGASNDKLEYAPKSTLGKKVVAIIDYGCPFAHRQFLDFKKQHLASRIKYFWDQDIAKTAFVAKGSSVDGVWWFPVKDYSYGRETTEPVISRLIQSSLTSSGELDEDAVYQKCNYETVSEIYSHGGVVMDLAAGQVNPRTGQTDAASEADIIFVQLPRETVYDTTGGAMSVYILDALSYIVSKCEDVDQLVINLSFGAAAGPHNGQSLIERAMDDFLISARKEKPFRQVDIVLAAGNHHEANLHARVYLKPSARKKTLKWQVMPDDCTDSYLELWCKADEGREFTISLTSPSGKLINATSFSENNRLQDDSGEKTIAAIFRPSTYNRRQDKFVSLIAIAPTHSKAWAQAEHGVWSIEIELNEKSKSTVEIEAWIERDDPMAWELGQQQSHFVSSDEYTLATELDKVSSDTAGSNSVSYFGTNSKISNGAKTIVVGSYIKESLVFDGAGRLKDFDLCDYSGAAPKILAEGRSIWPDYVAPGDQARSIPGILASGNRSGTWTRMNGTSVSAPQICRYLINEGSHWGVGVLKPSLELEAVLGSNRGKSSLRLV
jgi:Subtilase family